MQTLSFMIKQLAFHILAEGKWLLKLGKCLLKFEIVWKNQQKELSLCLLAWSPRQPWLKETLCGCSCTLLWITVLFVPWNQLQHHTNYYYSLTLIRFSCRIQSVRERSFRTNSGNGSSFDPRALMWAVSWVMWTEMMDIVALKVFSHLTDLVFLAW